MPFNPHNRSFLKEIDFIPGELRYLLRLAGALKLAKYAGTEVKQLDGKEIALIFEKAAHCWSWRALMGTDVRLVWAD